MYICWAYSELSERSSSYNLAYKATKGLKFLISSVLPFLYHNPLRLVGILYRIALREVGGTCLIVFVISVSIYSLQYNLFPIHLTFCVHSCAIHLSHFISVPSVELFTVTDLMKFVFSIGFGTRLRYQCEYQLYNLLNLFSFHLNVIHLSISSECLLLNYL